MSLVEIKDSDSDDSEIFIVEEIKPVKKLKRPVTTKTKSSILSFFIPKRTKANNDTIRKSSSDLNEMLPAKKQKLLELDNETDDKINSQNSNKSGEASSEQKQESGFSIVKQDARPDLLEKEVGGFSANFKNVHKAKSVKIKTHIKNSCKITSYFNKSLNQNIEKSELSIKVSSNEKCFKNSDSNEIIKTNQEVKPPVMTLDSIESSNQIKKEETCEIISDKIENNTHKKEENNDKCIFDENIETYLNNNKAELEELLLFSEFTNSFESPVVQKDEQFFNNSEILCFILKKIIEEERKKQNELEAHSLKNGKIFEKLISTSDSEIFEKFFNLKESTCRVFVRMLGRKKTWHRVCAINYKNLSDNINFDFDILHKSGFIDINIENEDLKTQLELLSKPEIMKLCKIFNVSPRSNNKNKKEVLINALIESTKKQKSVKEMFKNQNLKTRLDFLKSEIKNYLNMCIRLNQKVYQTFYKIVLLFSFAHYNDEESKRFNSELLQCFQVHKNIIKFPNFSLSPTVVFETLTDFEDYQKSLSIQDSFENAINNKNYNEFLCVCNTAKNEFKKLLENHEYQNRFFNLPSFLRKFSAGSIYARILTHYCKKFKKNTEILDIINTAELLIGQNIFLSRKKGEWYEILSKALESQKQFDKAAQVIIESLKNPDIDDVQKLTLQSRGLLILKRKSNGISDPHIKEVLNDVCKSSVEDAPCIEIKGKALHGNESGYKVVYVEDLKGDKVYTSVEQRAISYYLANGFSKGYHAEGSIVQSIYFLLFFDIIYGSSPQGVFQSPYQKIPLDLYSSSFYKNRKEIIDLLLDDMLSWDDEQIKIKIGDAYYKNINTTCIIDWNNILEPQLLCEIIKCITMPKLIIIFQRFLKNFKVARSGFPDLTLWNPETNKFKLAEVKSPNDKLMINQRVWLDFLVKIGIDCEVCKVKNVACLDDKSE